MVSNNDGELKSLPGYRMDRTTVYTDQAKQEEQEQRARWITEQGDLELMESTPGKTY